MSSLRHLVFSGLLSLAASSAVAQVTINFDDLSLANYAQIPASYGDGLVPHLSDVAYRTYIAATDVTVVPYLEFWNNDYGDLSKIAFSAENGRAAEIAFTPEAGYAVHLISFDMAGYNHQDRPNTIMRLVDSANNVVFDFAANGPVPIQGDTNGPQHSTFTPDITFNGTLRLQWGNDWDIGIDNIRLEAVAIPEPSTLALLGLGTAGILVHGLRRKRSRGAKTEV